MLERYSLPEMQKIWSDENNFRTMLQIEIYALEAMKDNGSLDPETYQAIKENADVDVRRVKEIEAIVKHDVTAFLMAISEKVGEENAQKLHFGMTSSDILDTALSVQMRQAAELITGELYSLRNQLLHMAKQYKYDFIVGRTHGIHAEPMTFGLKMALWVTDAERCIEFMHQAKNYISVGKINGNVGTYANLDPFVEEHVCRRLELKPATITNQIIQRDRHAFFLNQLALIGSILDKFATEIRNLERTEIGEISEPYSEKQRGSSSLPHKHNPVIAERISGLARILRANAGAALENIPLWHERDTTHMSVERVIIPDSCILTHYMIRTMTELLQKLIINVDVMRQNIYKTQGLIFSQSVMVALINKGMQKEHAFDLVSSIAAEAHNEHSDFQYCLIENPEVMEYLSPGELDLVFDLDRHIKHIDYIYNKAHIE